MDVEKVRQDALLDGTDRENDSRKYAKVIEDGPEESVSVCWKDIKPQILAANVGFAFTLHAGVNLVFSNLVLDDFNIHVSSWFASIVGFATPMGACTSALIMDKCGRKTANIVTAVPCLLSYLLMYHVSADQIALLYTARFLAGIAGGLTTANMVYVSEISHKKYRPIFLSLLTVYTSLGVLLTTVSKLMISWRRTALCYSALFALFAAAVIFCTPESPLWLIIMRRDRTAARKSLKKLYSNDEVAEAEWRALVGRGEANDASSSGSRKVTLTSRIVYKPFCFLCILILLQQLSGFYVSVFYVIKVFPALSADKGEKFKDEAFFVSGVIRLVASLAGSLMSARVPRKTLFTVSSLGMLVSCALAVGSVYRIFPLFNEELAIASFLLYVGAGSVGVMNIPWTLTAELLPTEVRGIGSTVLVSYGYILMSVFAKIFPFLLESYGVSFVFGFFGVMSAVLGLFMRVFIPETLGKSFDEIEEYFEK